MCVRTKGHPTNRAGAALVFRLRPVGRGRGTSSSQAHLSSHHSPRHRTMPLHGVSSRIPTGDDRRLPDRAQGDRSIVPAFAPSSESNLSVTNPATPCDVIGFHDTPSEMAEFARETGWALRYIGDWGHPRGQVMTQFH